jgi:3-oxoadipate enol-lactonase
MPTAEVNGTTLHYELDGPDDAPVIVFSHSLFFDSAMFVHQVDGLGDRYRVLRYDHRGQGRSAAAGSQDELDMDTLTEDLSALLTALDIDRAHIAGNSMGGFIALRMAARHPDQTASAIVLGSSAEEEHKLADFEPLVEHLKVHGTGDVIDTLMHIMFGDDTLGADPASDTGTERDRWRASMLELPPAIGLAAHGVIHRGPVLSELADCQVPMLVLAGETDHAYEQALSEHIATTAPEARWQVVAGAGHSVALEQPAAVNDAIDAWVGSLAAEVSR